MRYIDEFRNRSLIGKVTARIRSVTDPEKNYRFMDVCGTHTMSIFKFGLKSLIPENIELISGPGCPVCVTPNIFIDKAIALSKLDHIIIATFGDMFRVPGSVSSLEEERAKGGDIRVVYSAMDALELAKRNPAKEVVFLGIGFETTTPTVAVSILSAQKNGIKNYSVLSGHKTMPEALAVLAKDPDVRVDGFLLPGHVSAIIGPRPYLFLAERYAKRCVIAGFEPLDILQAIMMLIIQERPCVEVQYSRVIEKEGNPAARSAIVSVFAKTDSAWRGIGMIEKSGLKIKNAYAVFDAERRFNIKIKKPRENKNCICGEVLKGARKPVDCRLFAKRCTPEHPVGSCMVSSEGTCAAYYKYGKNGKNITLTW